MRISDWSSDVCSSDLASADEIEAEGVRRALARAAAADLRIVVLDATAWPSLPAELRGRLGADDVIVANKCDLATLPAGATIGGLQVRPNSVKTAAGLGAIQIGNASVRERGWQDV